jgi:hypothetical protein
MVPWALTYKLLGYGVRGSGAYLDPSDRPLQFVLALFERIPTLMLGLWGPVPVDGWAFSPRSAQLMMTAAGGLALLGMTWLLWPILRARPRARFWALGLLLSLVPLCGAFPMSRLLVFAGLGAFGLLAEQAEAIGLCGAAPTLTLGKARHVLFAAALALHAVLGCALLPLQTWAVDHFFGQFEIFARQLPDDEAITQQTLVFVQGHDLLAGDLVFMQLGLGHRIAAHVAVLASVMTKAQVTREDLRTLVIESEHGWLYDAFDRLFRHPSVPFTAGERISAKDFTATVRATTDDGRPLRVAFRFNRPLEDPSLRWIGFDGAKLVAWTPPPVGATVHLDTDLVRLAKDLAR